jgi:predicted patatin/cPLA2 family phospholipase
MKDIWFNISDKDVYEYGVFNPFYKWSFYDTTPLNNTISKIIESLNNKETIPTLIGATNLNYGKLDIFDIHTENILSQQDILLASSAVPIAFPPITMNDNIYVDGGLITNEIIYNLKKYINCDYYNITFLDTTNPYKEKHNISSIGDYISDIIGLLLNNFDVDMMKRKKCDYVNGQINVYYLDKQHNISILDFNRVQDLYDYGKNYKYKKFDYCD